MNQRIFNDYIRTLHIIQSMKNVSFDLQYIKSEFLELLKDPIDLETLETIESFTVFVSEQILFTQKPSIDIQELAIHFLDNQEQLKKQN